MAILHVAMLLCDVRSGMNKEIILLCGLDYYPLLSHNTIEFPPSSSPSYSRALPSHHRAASHDALFFRNHYRAVRVQLLAQFARKRDQIQRRRVAQVNHEFLPVLLPFFLIPWRRTVKSDAWHLWETRLQLHHSGAQLGLSQEVEC